MTCQCSFIDCNRCTTQVLDSDSRGVRVCVYGAESNEKLLYFIQFAVNL